jgi:hypothetical protein
MSAADVAAIVARTSFLATHPGRLGLNGPDR